MRHSTPVALELMKFPLTLAAGVRTTFDEFLPMPLPGRLAALMHRLDRGESGHGASTTEAPNRIDRRG
jgi:hypothetical protein